MALGAGRADILGLVVRQSLLFILIGVAAGIVTAVALSRAIASLLYGVGPMDAATFAVSALVLILVGVAASYIPARRAARVDPAVALRQE